MCYTSEGYQIQLIGYWNIISTVRINYLIPSTYTSYIYTVSVGAGKIASIMLWGYKRLLVFTFRFTNAAIEYTLFCDYSQVKMKTHMPWWRHCSDLNVDIYFLLSNGQHKKMNFVDDANLEGIESRYWTSSRNKVKNTLKVSLNNFLSKKCIRCLLWRNWTWSAWSSMHAALFYLETWELALLFFPLLLTRENEEWYFLCFQYNSQTVAHILTCSLALNQTLFT